MKQFLKIFNFYLNSSIHVSLAVVALQLVSCITLNIYYDKNLLFFTFFASITGYNFIKYSSLAKWHHLSLTETLRVIQVFSMLSFVAMLYFISKLDVKVLITCIALGSVTALYALPIFSFKQDMSSERLTLRSLKGIKIYVIAIVWAGTAVLLPLFQAEEAVSWDAGILLMQLFLFVIVITLPFDIRDVKYDAISIATIPLRVGVKKAKIVGVLLLISLLLLEALKDKITSDTFVSLLVISILSGVFLLISSEKQSKYYASFWVESIPLLWLILLYCINVY